MSWISKGWHQVESWFKKEAPIVKADVEQAIVAAEPAFKNILSSAEGQIALSVVNGLNADGSLSNAQKAEQAAISIAEQVKAAGLSAGEALVNLLRELAVTALKKFVV